MGDEPFQTSFYMLSETLGETTMWGTSKEKAKVMTDHSHMQVEVSDFNLPTVLVRVAQHRCARHHH